MQQDAEPHHGLQVRCSSTAMGTGQTVGRCAALPICLFPNLPMLTVGTTHLKCAGLPLPPRGSPCCAFRFHASCLTSLAVSLHRAVPQCSHFPGELKLKPQGFLHQCLGSCRSALGLPPGAAAVVTNGRLVPLPRDEPLVAEDFDLLALYANSAQVAQQVWGLLPAVCRLVCRCSVLARTAESCLLRSNVRVPFCQGCPSACAAPPRSSGCVLVICSVQA